MCAPTLHLPRASRILKRLSQRQPDTHLVPREKVISMLQEIAYVLHVTRKVKSGILRETADQSRSPRPVK